jgi:hypothetical protein
LRYDIDDSLPWHSTISRTRQLYGEGVFLELFQQVLRLCAEKRMVRGRRTVEPVLGTLINFFNMKKINSRGMAQANKHVLMAALTYNLKKYLKFTRLKIITIAHQMPGFQETLQNSHFMSSICVTRARQILTSPNSTEKLTLA